MTNNSKYMGKIIKFFGEIFGLLEMFDYDDECFIYGSLLTSFMAKKDIMGKNINIFIPNLKEEHFVKILDRLYERDYINHQDYQDYVITTMVIDKEVIYIKCWTNIINILDKTFEITFHDTAYLNDLMFDIDNIILTQHGIKTIIKTDLDIKKKNNYMGISLLSTMNNMLDNKVESCKIIEDLDSIDAKFYIFQKYEKEKELKKDGYEIIFGFSTKEDKCPICFDDKELINLKCSHSFCYDCLKSHSFNISYNNDSCPLCRGNLKIDIKK